MDNQSDQEHVLLAFATRRLYRTTPELPEKANYNLIRGCWLIDDSPLARSPEGTMIPTTKKCDQETGEDQKGE